MYTRYCNNIILDFSNNTIAIYCGATLGFGSAGARGYGRTAVLELLECTYIYIHIYVQITDYTDYTDDGCA